MKPGIYEDLPFKDYVKIDAVNHSSLKNIDISPKYYLHKKETNTDSDAMSKGRAIHQLVLEPEKFNDVYAICDASSRNTKIYKGFKASNYEKEILLQKEYDEVKEISDQLTDDIDIQRILSGAKKELTLVWFDKATGLKCKCRIDIFKGHHCMDLKTTSDVKPFQFNRSAHKYSYHSQFAFYNRGIIATGLAEKLINKIIVVQTFKPYDHFIVDVPKITVKAGDETVSEWMDLLKTCMVSDFYPGLNNDYHEFLLPSWAYDKEEE